MIAGLTAGILGAVALVIWFAIEQADKDYRQENNLPPRKYHDTTDQDVTIVHTIQHHSGK